MRNEDEISVMGKFLKDYILDTDEPVLGHVPTELVIEIYCDAITESFSLVIPPP